MAPRGNTLSPRCLVPKHRPCDVPLPAEKQLTAEFDVTMNQVRSFIDLVKNFQLGTSTHVMWVINFWVRIRL